MPRPTLPAALAAVVLALAACAGPSTVTVPTTPSPSASTRPVVPAAFLVAYRADYPALAAGRSSKGLQNDALNTCATIRAGETTAVLTRQTIARFAAQDGTAPTEAEAAGILALVRKHVCP